MRTVLMLLSLLVFVVLSSGCVFAGIGAGIGAAVPKYDECEIESSRASCSHDHELLQSQVRAPSALEAGARVEVLAADSEPTTGTYLRGGADGVVLARADESQITDRPDRAVVKCVIDRLKDLAFPTPTGAVVSVVFGLIFESS